MNQGKIPLYFFSGELAETLRKLSHLPGQLSGVVGESYRPFLQLSDLSGELAEHSGELPEITRKLPEHFRELSDLPGELPERSGELSEMARRLAETIGELVEMPGKLGLQMRELSKERRSKAICQNSSTRKMKRGKLFFNNFPLSVCPGLDSNQ
ncbi:hypothetical protein GCM10011379_26000 [Filimonas zeae]|uniref:Uncharacterized protein n=1 Tax=Filimonas zeae TaxID=1737353 RepID=A0A917MWJ8_9BACT|nr:hypothetical protein [Filimonas zeae]GGH69068.1 hypothetical protein GCM10011379_26000 [Filimonas zeae]